MRPLHLEKDYNLINREERNLTAILYSALCNTNNVNEFLKLIGASSDLITIETQPASTGVVALEPFDSRS